MTTFEGLQEQMRGIPKERLTPLTRDELDTALDQMFEHMWETNHVWSIEEAAEFYARLLLGDV